MADAAETPSRFGRTYQVEGFFGFNSQDFGPTKPALAAIAADPVLGTNDALVAVAESGNASVTMYTHDPVGAPSQRSSPPDGCPALPTRSPSHRPVPA